MALLLDGVFSVLRSVLKIGVGVVLLLDGVVGGGLPVVSVRRGYQLVGQPVGLLRLLNGLGCCLSSFLCRLQCKGWFNGDGGLVGGGGGGGGHW